ncbi:ribonuclease H [Solenopsis invicta]|uniref:ribonuclease H n=1 Tax=Solenopsis invicta TaxID=13686 RepID=UPI0001FE93E6|nr:ribonuclease H [Solenopsis invicta]
MPYYGVAKGRNTGVYDNWEDCKDQVNRYSNNSYKKFDTPAQAHDFIDQQSSRSNTQLEGRHMEANSYHRTEYTSGRNTTIVHERSYASGTDGNRHFVENSTRTSWQKH